MLHCWVIRYCVWHAKKFFGSLFGPPSWAPIIWQRCLQFGLKGLLFPVSSFFRSSQPNGCIVFKALVTLHRAVIDALVMKVEADLVYTVAPRGTYFGPLWYFRLHPYGTQVVGVDASGFGFCLWNAHVNLLPHTNEDWKAVTNQSKTTMLTHFIFSAKILQWRLESMMVARVTNLSLPFYMANQQSDVESCASMPCWSSVMIKRECSPALWILCCRRYFLLNVDA